MDVDDPVATIELERIDAELRAITGRDLQLWSIIVLVMILLLLGLLSYLVPNALGGAKEIDAKLRFVPELSFGLVALVLLLNFYMIRQRQALNRTRSALIGQMVRNPKLAKLSLMDPVTELFKRDCLPEILTVELRKRNALGGNLTFLMLRPEGDAQVIRSPRFAAQLASLLRSNFRGCDPIVRYSDCEYLVLMPQTSLAQAEKAVSRLLALIEQWNVSTTSEPEILLSTGMEECTAATDGWIEIRRASQTLYAARPDLSSAAINVERRLHIASSHQ